MEKVRSVESVSFLQSGIQLLYNFWIYWGKEISNRPNKLSKETQITKPTLCRTTLSFFFLICFFFLYLYFQTIYLQTAWRSLCLREIAEEVMERNRFLNVFWISSVSFTISVTWSLKEFVQWKVVIQEKVGKISGTKYVAYSCW